MHLPMQKKVRGAVLHGDQVCDKVKVTQDWARMVMDINLSRVQELVMDREAWIGIVLGISKSWTPLSD